MKKLFSIMFMAMVAIVCVTFTACGGDDGDSSTGTPPGQGVTGSTEYVDPCLDFGSSVAHLKEYMSGSVWQLDENSNDVVLLYSNNGAATVLNYMFISSRLHMVTVTYAGGGEARANAFKSEIEKRYGVTMTRENDPADAAQLVYSCMATINGISVSIALYCYAQGINIIYSPSE